MVHCKGGVWFPHNLSLVHRKGDVWFPQFFLGTRKGDVWFPYNLSLKIVVQRGSPTVS